MVTWTILNLSYNQQKYQAADNHHMPEGVGHDWSDLAAAAASRKEKTKATHLEKISVTCNTYDRKRIWILESATYQQEKDKSLIAKWATNRIGIS